MRILYETDSDILMFLTPATLAHNSIHSDRCKATINSPICRSNKIDVISAGFCCKAGMAINQDLDWMGTGRLTSKGVIIEDRISDKNAATYST